MEGVRPPDAAAANGLLARLETFEARKGRLPGLATVRRHEVFVARILESQRRNRYFELIRLRPQRAQVADPAAKGFDPHRGAVYRSRLGEYDEACWLVFLAVHFGRHRRADWRYVRDVYGGLGAGCWSWSAVSSDVPAFRGWLDTHGKELRAGPGPHGFGNHRKYESLNAWGERGTGAAVAGYVDLVRGAGGHASFLGATQGESRATHFDRLFISMRAVPTFGRTADFDYLVHLRNLGLLDVEPGKAYLVGATGPRQGATLLFTGVPGASSVAELESKLAELEADLNVGYDVLEDAMCNWQKSPDVFTRFRG